MRYVAWGYPDFSVRMHSLDGDKVMGVTENLHDGPITCMACTKNEDLLVIGGVDTVPAFVAFVVATRC